ncbi:hypothetical protein HGG76_25720 [Ochrobactrum tritici]|nr:hypothetical protein [Brucella tritici]
MSSLAPEQFGWLSDAQVGVMSGPQLRSVPDSSVGLIAPKLKPEQIPELTTPQMEAITAKHRLK